MSRVPFILPRRYAVTGGFNTQMPIENVFGFFTAIQSADSTFAPNSQFMIPVLTAGDLEIARPSIPDNVSKWSIATNVYNRLPRQKTEPLTTDFLGATILGKTLYAVVDGDTGLSAERESARQSLVRLAATKLNLPPEKEIAQPLGNFAIEISPELKDIVIDATNKMFKGFSLTYERVAFGKPDDINRGIWTPPHIKT